MTLKLPPEPFHFSGDYYDLIYKDKDYFKESKYISQHLSNYKPGSRELLELGSGTGNYSLSLCSLGYDITGIEKVQQLVQAANAKKIKGFQSLVGDITSFQLNRKFDAAVSLFHVLSYLNENEKIINCLKQVCKHLVNGGIFIFDVWYTPAVYSQKPEPRIKKIESDEYEIIRFAEPIIDYQTNVVQVNYKMLVSNKLSGKNTILEESHHMRHFSIPEIKFFAELTGFNLIHTEEFLTSKEPGPDTWGICCILKKYE